MSVAMRRKLAHELGNQLGIVISYAELLLEELGSDDPKRDEIETIDRTSRRLMRVFDGVTTFEELGDDRRQHYTSQLSVIRQACESVLAAVPRADRVAADVREMLKATEAVEAMGGV